MDDQVRTVESLLERLGSTVVTAEYLPNATRQIGAVLIESGSDDEPNVDALALAIGARSAADLAGQLQRMGARGLTGLIVDRRAELDDTCRQIAEHHQVNVLRSTGALSWSQLAEAVWRFVDEDRVLLARDSFEASTADLFSLANTVSNFIGAPVTIEDLSSAVLAFSSGDQDIDPARLASILDLRVPDRWQEAYRETGVYERVYRSCTPVLIPSDDGIVPRLAMPIVAGPEVLGSMWAAVSRMPSPDALAAFTSAAHAAGLLLLRRRRELDPQRRWHEEQLLTLLDAGADATRAARELRLEGKTLCVLAARVIDDSDASHDEPGFRVSRAATVQRLHQSLTLHLTASNPSVIAAIVDSTVYAAFPVPTSARDSSRALLAARSHYFRAQGAQRVVIGVGRPAGRLDDIPFSKADAEGVVDLLSAEHGSTLVASVGDVQGRLLMSAMRDLIAVRRLRPSRPIEELYAYDAERHAGLLDALRSYLDHFGNVVRAAELLQIHPNTFRYRLRSIARITGLDLDDPDTRFELTLQLKLYVRSPLSGGDRTSPALESTRR